MKSTFTLIFSLFIAFGAFSQINNDDVYVPGVVFIKLKNNIDVKKDKSNSLVNVQQELPFLSNYSNFPMVKVNQPFYFSKNLTLLTVFKLELANVAQINDFMSQIKNDANVEYVERVPITRKIYTPNDPVPSSFYHLGVIKANDAWDITQGGIEIKVAVVDDAIQTDHPDLQGNCLAGRDVADGDNDPRPPSTDYSHGTHVSGIVGAVSNNGIGISSVGLNKVKIIPVKSTNTSSYISHAYEGVVWAANNGAKIINMSWGSSGYSLTYQNVMNDAYNMGIVLIAAAGNSSTSSKSYPAGYDNVVAVVSTDYNDAKSYYSNYGDWVDICAPGSYIYSTVPFNSYDSYSGTSMASPLTAGAFAFVWGTRPNLTNTELIALMKNAADNINTQNPSYVGLLGAGRLNVLRAISCTDINASITPSGSVAICSGQNTVLTVSAVVGATYQWYKDGVQIGTNSQTLTVNTAGTYYAVVSKNNCGLSTNQVVVSVQPSSVTITPSRSNLTLCGDFIDLSVPNITGMTYQWKRNNVNIGTNSNLLSANQTGIYSVTLTNTINTSCPTLQSNAVELTGLSYNITPSPSLIICPGQTDTLVANYYSNALYQWRRGSEYLGSNTNKLAVNESGNYFVTITTSECGSKSSSTVAVSVIPNDISITTNISPVICGTQSVVISAPSIAGVTYRWQRNQVDIGSNSSILTATQSGDYRVIVSNGTICIDTSNIVTISDFSQSISLTPTNPIICNGSSTVLTATNINNATYQWKKDGAFVGTNSPTLTANQSGTYSVTITSNSCSRTTNFSNVSVMPNSVSIIANRSTLLCQGQTISLSTTSLVGVNYQWKKNGVNVGQNSSTYSTTEAGSYTVTLTGAGCPALTSSAMAVSIINHTVTISPPDTAILCTGNSITLTGNTITGAIYQWKKNSADISGANATAYTANTTGEYYLNATVLGCSFNSNKVAVKVFTNQSPTPTAVNASVCYGNAIVAGNGLKVNVQNCSGATSLTSTYTGPTVGYDNGNISGSNPTVSYSTTGTTLNSMTVSITWEKKDADGATTCSSSDGGGYPYNGETEFKLRAPNGALITLISSGSYGGSYAGVVTTVFSDLGNIINIGATPSSGTFKPEQLLSYFNGTNPQGVWTLEPRDTGFSDPLCVSGFSINFVVASNAPGNTPPTITWWDSPTGTTKLHTGAEYIPATSTLPVGTYTYYAQTACANNCLSNRVPVTLTVLPARPTKPGIVISKNGNTLSSPVTICNTDSYVLTANTTCSGQFQWSNGQTGNPINVSPSASTTYTVKCFDSSFTCNNNSLDSEPVNILLTPSILNIDNPLPSNTIQSFFATSLFGKSLINPTSNVIYKASGSVTLQPGFEVSSTSNNLFKAYIGGCLD